MGTIGKYLHRIGWLAVAYFVTGKLGLLLAVPPGYATAVFPPAGIALAGLLLFGHRAWPGILLGSFLMNVSVTFDWSSPAAIGTSLFLAFGIGGGATIQALCGAYLVRRFVAFPLAFNRGRQVLSLLFWGGPIACLVNAIIGISILVAAERIPLENFLFNSATWWIGDTFGVLVFLPLILLWAQNWDRSRLAGNMAVTLPAACAFVAAVIVVWHASSWEKSRLSNRFAHQAGFLSSAIGESLSQSRSLLDALSSFLIVTDRPSREQFQTFAKGLMADRSWLQALSWNPRIRHEDRESFEAQGRALGYSNFRITERDEDGQLVSAGDREEYVSVFFIEPYESNEAAIGYDVASNATRRTALAQARDTGMTATTGRITLVQEAAQQFGVLTFQPVYHGDVGSASVAARSGALRGYVVSVLRLGDLINETLADLDTTDLVFRLLDRSAAPDQQLLFASPLHETGITELEERGLFGGVSLLFHTSDFSYGGRDWTLQIVPTQKYVARHRPENAWLILLGGLAIASLVVAFSVVFMGRDREMVRLVAELSDTHSRLMLIMSSAAEAIYGVDREGRCTFCNAACLRMLGYEREEELIGRDMHRLVHAPNCDGPGDPLENCCVGETILRHRHIHDSDALLWRRDGSSFPVEYWSHPIQSEKGVVGAVVTFVDITERKRTEERLRSAQKIEALAQMTGGVAHEFNNLFMAVSGNLELIRDEIPTGSDVEENIDALVRILLRGGELTQSMLSYVGRQPLVRAAVDIEEAIGQSLNILRPTLGEGYDLEFEPRGDIWPAVTDTRGLQAAIMNLATNARDAMPDGGKITIETRNVRREESFGEERIGGIAAGDYVLVSLIDEGEGMPPGVRQRALDPFFTTKEVGKGTGLGLSAVYGFAKQLGGYVDIESEPGVGTSVSLFLPRADDVKVGTRERREPAAVREDGRQDVVALVVEDEPVVLDVVIGFLKKEGFTVHQAKNGDEAMEVVRKLERTDLLVTDIVMPGSVNGASLAKWVCKENPSSQIVFMTGYTESAIEEMGISLENMNVLRKPFTKDQLLGTIEKVLPYFALAGRSE